MKDRTFPSTQRRRHHEPNRNRFLEFDPDLNKLRKGKKLWDGLSAVVQIGDTLWVANDEALRGCEKTGSVNFGGVPQFT